MFLYGDCSPSPLAMNYLGYLRRALGLAVEIVLAEERLADVARRRRALRARVAKLEARLEALRQTVHGTVSAVASAPEDDPVTRCANQIESGVDDAVARALADVHAQDVASEAELAARERAAHAACFEALATFVREHALPGAVHEVEFESRDAGGRAIARATTPYQIATEIDLELAATPLAGPEPRAGALIAVRPAALKLDKLIVASAQLDPRAIELRLRASREPGAEGFDVRVARGSGDVELARVRRRGEVEAMAPSADDARALVALATAVAAALEAPLAGGGRLRGVTVDDAPLDEHERPSIVVDRVLAAMAPAVRPIIDRSVTPGELRLLRDLGDGRREEIFVTHAALVDLVAQVPAGRRHHFDVLGLPGLAPARPATAEIDPEMIHEEAEVSDPSISIGYDDEPPGDP